METFPEIKRPGLPLRFQTIEGGNGMTKYKSQLQAGYRLFLTGSNDGEMREKGVTDAEIHKIKKFHDSVEKGEYLHSITRKLQLEKHNLKNMLQIYQDYKDGKPLSDDTERREKYPSISLAFSMLLDGATPAIMTEKGCTDYEIEKAEIFMEYVHRDMFPSCISKETGISKNCIQKMFILYRKKQELLNRQNPLI